MIDKKRSWAVPIVLVLLAIPLAGWLLRSTIATAIARSELEARGITCGDAFEIELSALFDEASLGPTRCAPADDGLIEAVELTGVTTIALEGFEPASISAEGVRVILRDRDVSGGSGWAAALRRIRLEQRVAGLVKGLSELGGMRLPVSRVAQGEIVQGGDVLAHIEGLVMTPSSSMDVALQRVSFSAVGGAASLTLDGVTGTASSSAVRLEGQATARAGIALLGTFSTGGPFAIEATALDTANPRFHLEADF